VSVNPRIEELRRRIQKDPASIAFAQLAEEHRRAGQFEDAVNVCQAGLAQHPAYLSARITLGRALLEMRRYDEAASEFADIEQRRRARAPQVEVEVKSAVEPEPPPQEVDLVIAELEAWLAVLSDERDSRVTRI